MEESQALFTLETLFSAAALLVPVAIVLIRKRSYKTNSDNNHHEEDLKAINHIIEFGKMANVIQYPTDNSDGSPQNSMVLESTSDFLHQVAGHTCEVLRKFQYKIMKPMVKPKLFRREIELYEEMLVLGNHCTQTAKSFVPNYYGVLSISNGDSYRPYLVLKDLTISYLKPCIIDIKMGTQTYEPSASIEKKTREHDKYSHQKTIGFRITGFKVFDITKLLYYSVNKSFGRSLKPEQVKDGLKLYFFNGKIFRREILMRVIQKLEKILVWLKSQSKLHFYCSSILIVFDGFSGQDNLVDRFQTSNEVIRSPFSCDPNATNTLQKYITHHIERIHDKHVNQLADDNKIGSKDVKERYYVNRPQVKSKQYVEGPVGYTYTAILPSQSTTADRALANLRTKASPYDDAVQVRMIDFAHTLPSEESTERHVRAIDQGYIIGIVNLIEYLRSIVDDIDNRVPYHGVPDHLDEILKKSITVSLE